MNEDQRSLEEEKGPKRGRGRIYKKEKNRHSKNLAFLII